MVCCKREFGLCSVYDPLKHALRYHFFDCDQRIGDSWIAVRNRITQFTECAGKQFRGVAPFDR